MNIRKKIYSPVKHASLYSRLFLETLTKPVVIYMILVGNLILTGCVILFFNFESGINPKVRSVFDAFWWGMSTVTTVGYGDIIPVTFGGKIVSLFLMIAGIVFFVGWTAIVMSIFLRHAEEEIQRSERISFLEYELLMEKLDEISQRLINLEKNQLGKRKDRK